jgi:diadenosine tetraphosphate (Ap4A) HIT family hydrolase|tara:strand:+ start:13960 stop:14418 length:459 start_codon:yes stop_codon:yes gene_type:complete
MFNLDQRLQNDTILIGRLPLCQVLLMNDKRYPWVILVPAHNDVYEYYHLSEEDQMQLMKESSMVSQKMADHFSAKSMNIAALGNLVPQLHQHHICRYVDDPAWPGPVWGHSAAIKYSADELEIRVKELQGLLQQHFIEDLEAEDDAENVAYW